MFNKNNWKEPIYKDDLIYVLLNGFISAILCGILAGVIDYLFIYLQVPFRIDFGYIIIVFIVSYRIRNAFNTNHILYALLAIIFLFLSFYIAYVTPHVMGAIIYGIDPFYVFKDPMYYLYFIMPPASSIPFLMPAYATFSPTNLIFDVIEVFFMAYAFYYTYTSVRRRR